LSGDDVTRTSMLPVLVKLIAFLIEAEVLRIFDKHHVRKVVEEGLDECRGLP
jgi:hypothetical protein